MIEVIVILLNSIIFYISSKIKDRWLVFDQIYIFSTIHYFVILFIIFGKLLTMKYVELNANYWLLWNNDKLYYKLLYLNTIFHFATISFYIILNRYFKIETVKKIYVIEKKIDFVSWLILIIFLVLFNNLVLNRIFSSNYLLTYFSIPILVSVSIFFGLIILQFKDSIIRITLIIFLPLIFFFFYNIFLSDNSVNKGGLISIIIFLITFISFYDENIRKLMRKYFLFGIISLIIIIALMNTIDDEDFWFKWFLYYIINSFELRIIENQAQIVNGLQTDKIDYFFGRSYLNAFYELFFPFTETYSLSNWFAEKFYPDIFYNSNSRFAFSFLAEGYLNFGILGVILSSFFVSILLLFINKISKLNNFYSPLIYSFFCTTPYLLYRYHLLYIIKKAQFYFLSFILIFGLLAIIIYFKKKYKKKLI